MREIISELRENGEDVIDRWIAEQRAENLYLDCKLKEKVNVPSLDTNDKRNLVRAVSAFANSEGGILIWGIDARKQGEVDAMVGKRPITNLRAFRSEVEQTLAETVAPPIPNLDFVEISAKGSAQAGFLAVIVPLSERRPHMSSYSSASGFYFRNGHRSCLMEAFQVRDQMMRKAVPKLEFEWEPRIRTQEITIGNRLSQRIPLSIDLVLKNNSLVSARFPYLLVRVDRGRYLNMGSAYADYARHGIPVSRIGRIEGFPRHPEAGSISQDTEFSGGADCCIHPGASLRVAEMQVWCPVSIHYDLGSSRLMPKDAPFLTVLAEISYGCLDSPIDLTTLTLEGGDVYASLSHLGQAGAIALPL